MTNRAQQAGVTIQVGRSVPDRRRKWQGFLNWAPWSRRGAPGRSALPPGQSQTGLRIARAGLWAAWLLASLPLVAPAQSLWKEDISKPMFADKRGVGKGDLLTIVVQESTTASKNNQTATSKKASMDAAIQAFLYSPAASGLLTQKGQLPALKYSMDNAFSGGGTIDNSENIVARVTVEVIDVLPNRNLVVEGRRETSFAGEKQNIILHGIVRPEDVTSANTVFSYNVADAKIQIIGKGIVSDKQRRGWFTWLWDKLTPF